MRLFSVILAICSFLFTACSENVRQIDLQDKCVFKTSIIIENADNYTKGRPKKIYFKRLESIDNLTKGTIISSEVRDGNEIMINVEPGIYTVIAAELYDQTDLTMVCFNEETMNYLKTEIKKGETKSTGDIYILKNSAGLFGNIDDLQMKHREIIGSQNDGMRYYYKLGEIDKSMHNIRPKKSPEQEKEYKIEEYK